MYFLKKCNFVTVNENKDNLGKKRLHRKIRKRNDVFKPIIAVDLAWGLVWHKAVPIRNLTAGELRFLALLAEGGVQPRRRGLAMAVSRLRDKLARAGVVGYIRTVRGGYSA